MNETIAETLSDYANRRGGQPVNLADPAVAQEVAAAVVAALDAATNPAKPAAGQ